MFEQIINDNILSPLASPFPPTGPTAAACMSGVILRGQGSGDYKLNITAHSQDIQYIEGRPQKGPGRPLPAHEYLWAQVCPDAYGLCAML